MQSDRVYRLPVSNIAYHVYSLEEDQDRLQAVSEQAFRRTMDSYHEHEQLADRFQVELGKRQTLLQERKEHEKLLKQQKKSYKRSQKSQSQDRSHPEHQPTAQPERHSLRQKSRITNSFASQSSIGDTKITAGLPMHLQSSTGGLKRTRRLSDVSSSDISGYGEDDVGKSSHLKVHSTSTSSRHDELTVPRSRSIERSLSSSPAPPVTPSPGHTPSDSNLGNENQQQRDGSASEPLNQPYTSSSISSLGGQNSSSLLSTTSRVPHPGNMISGRRKRKQAIPVHPSIVERIPGITIRIQREKQSEQLKVEILKTVEDYSRQSGSGKPDHDHQSKQDMLKVQQAIESGRTGYALFPSSTSSTYGETDLCHSSSMGFEWDKSLSTSFNSLAWSTSNGNSRETLASVHDLIDARSLPLSWENFSERECVVNKVVGKHDKDLDDLEEVVQDVIARQHYTQQQSIKHHQQEQEHDMEEISTTAAHSQRGNSVSSNGAGATEPTPASTSSRVSRTMNAPVRTLPTRATRSRTHGNEMEGKGRRGRVELVAHDDIELILKQKRKKKQEERRRLSSMASSKDENEDEDDERHTHSDEEDDDDGDQETSTPSREKTAEEPDGKEQEEQDTDIRAMEEEGIKAEGLEDVPMTKRSRQYRKRQASSMERDAANVGNANATKRSKTPSNTTSRVIASRNYHQPKSTDKVSLSSPSSGSEEDNVEEDADYHDSSNRAAAEHRKRRLSDPKIPLGSLRLASTSPAKARRSIEKRTSLPPPPSAPIFTSETTASVNVRRNKKAWSRGKNSRKVDEVGTTTDDSSSGTDGEDEDGDKAASLTAISQPTRDAHHKNKIISAEEQQTIARDKTTIPTAMSLSNRPRKLSLSVSMPKPTAASTSVVNAPLQTPLSATYPSKAQASESGGRTRARARARSFSSTFDTGDKTNFFESALGVIDQKRRDALERKKAAKSERAEEKERQEQEERKKNDKEKDRLVAVARQHELEQQQHQNLQRARAQKIEASNLPKSSKSLPGRVLRRTKADASTEEGYVDPDCTSCRMELSESEKALWKAAQESGDIWLPKTWGTHAILCATCRLQYLEHHSRCTACFYVPVQQEMAISGATCSRCKAGTWLTEAVRPPPGAVFEAKKDNRRKNVSEISA
ncbi:hypothetical protein BGZ51_008546 [Haplosporangium sp. Z 767]|nr:hypothetical protein BGZ51_008546 [Haplosporangium sp. Z 767]KAF9196858.1 hypothetical protein BGZ50_005932 [Haplosporangium sp. Z 11]